VIELNIARVARRGFGALRGNPVAESVVEDLARDLQKGCAAVTRLTQFGPFIPDEAMTDADIVGCFFFMLANRTAKAVIEVDLLAIMQARPSVAQALADQ
jgi:hypothetical protein